MQHSSHNCGYTKCIKALVVLFFYLLSIFGIIIELSFLTNLLYC